MKTRIQASLTLFSLLLSHALLAEPLFYKAEKDGKELMILGSIHMGKPEMYPLPEEVMQFLRQSDALITEAELTGEVPPFRSDAPVTRDILTDAQKNKLMEINELLGFPPKALLHNQAWQAALTLQVAQFNKMGFSQELGVDNYITSRAKALNKPVMGLETLEFQMDLFTQDPETGKALLTDTIDNWDKNREISECLVQSWQAGNSAQLAKLAEESNLDEELGELFIYERNQNWARLLDSDSLIRKGKYLIVVGALHLVGKENFIQLLSEQGFEVIRMSDEEKAACI